MQNQFFAPFSPNTYLLIMVIDRTPARIHLLDSIIYNWSAANLAGRYYLLAGRRWREGKHPAFVGGGKQAAAARRFIFTVHDHELHRHRHHHRQPSKRPRYNNILLHNDLDLSSSYQGMSPAPFSRPKIYQRGRRIVVGVSQIIHN